uniref:Uncharacterized protein n=1 Tax=Arundo donax TaxID=35708 RepID=A0A0A9A7P4_ARUDO
MAGWVGGLPVLPCAATALGPAAGGGGNRRRNRLQHSGKVQAGEPADGDEGSGIGVHLACAGGVGHLAFPALLSPLHPSAAARRSLRADGCDKGGQIRVEWRPMAEPEGALP